MQKSAAFELLKARLIRLEEKKAEATMQRRFKGYDKFDCQVQFQIDEHVISSAYVRALVQRASCVTLAAHARACWLAQLPMYVIHYKYLFTDHMGFVSGITGLASGPTHLSAGKVALAVAGAEVLAAAAFTAGKLLLFPPFWEFVIVTSGMAAAASQFAPLAEKLLLFGQRKLSRPTASGPDDYVR